MNEQNNIAVIQQIFACFGKGDVPGILHTLAADVRWNILPAPNVPWTGLRHGQAGATEFFTVLEANEVPTQFEPREFIAQGDKVVAHVQYAARVKATGREYTTYLIQIWTVQNGKVTAIDQYTDTAASAAAYTKAQSA